jgi:hypothetical protein
LELRIAALEADLELRIAALETSQAQILNVLGRIEGDTNLLKSYLQSARGGWRVLVVIGGILVGLAGVAGVVGKFVRGSW